MHINPFFRLTYRLMQPSEEQVMIPDLVLFIEPHSAINYELFFVEGKAIIKIIIWKTIWQSLERKCIPP